MAGRLAREAINDPELRATLVRRDTSPFTAALRVIADAQRAGMLTPLRREEVVGLLGGAMRLGFTRGEVAAVGVLGRILLEHIDRARTHSGDDRDEEGIPLDPEARRRCQVLYIVVALDDLERLGVPEDQALAEVRDWRRDRRRPPADEGDR